MWLSIIKMNKTAKMIQVETPNLGVYKYKPVNPETLNLGVSTNKPINN
jgi:hypothetical protein